jgi:colicin import membrane protein
MQPFAFQPQLMKDDPRALVFPVTVSILLHLLFAGAMVFSPRFGDTGEVVPRVINVSLVRSGPLRPDSGSPGSAPVVPVKKKAPAAEVSVAAPQKTVTPKVKKKVAAKPKRSLKKKTFTKTAAIKQAVENVEEKQEQERAESVAAAIEALRKKAAIRPPLPGKSESGGGNPVVEGPPRWGGGGTGGPLTTSQMEIYTAIISERIASNWSFPQQLAGNVEGLWTGIAVEIRQDGSIAYVRFARRSGNRFLDESAQKAVRKSDPLPPFPESYQNNVFRVKFRFTPRGLE